MEETSLDNKKLDELLELTRENHKLLVSEHRSKKLAAVKSIIRLAIIVAILAVAYSFLNPYIKNAKKIYESVSTQFQTISNAAQTLQDTGSQINNAGQTVSNFFGGFKDEFDSFSNSFSNDNE